MTPEEDELADLTLARMLGMKCRKLMGGPAWMWETPDEMPGFGFTDTPEAAARAFLDSYLLNHRTIEPCNHQTSGPASHPTR